MAVGCLYCIYRQLRIRWWGTRHIRSNNPTQHIGLMSRPDRGCGSIGGAPPFSLGRTAYYDSPSQNLRFSLTNIQWLLDTRKDAR